MAGGTARYCGPVPRGATDGHSAYGGYGGDHSRSGGGHDRCGIQANGTGSIPNDLCKGAGTGSAARQARPDDREHRRGTSQRPKAAAEEAEQLQATMRKGLGDIRTSCGQMQHALSQLLGAPSRGASSTEEDTEEDEDRNVGMTVSAAHSMWQALQAKPKVCLQCILNPKRDLSQCVGFAITDG